MLLLVTFTVKLELVFAWTFKSAFSWSFHFKANRKSMDSSKKRHKGFSKQPSVWEIGTFLCDNQWMFQTFSKLTLKQIFWKKKPFSKNWSTVFYLKPPRLKEHHSHSKLLCEKQTLRQIEWRLQNGPITKTGVLPVTALFLWKICFSFRTS